ncbi:AAA family ATPase [Streptomyces sp. NPDC020983]|uniref:AAA family ATPase n=1 Tax=Streptomyces sp. NPDC020983 TaxID=3365106 RepID=UPI0037B0F1E1
MRLHTLTLQAFGPFAGTHTIDFDTLTADGLFLLHGDTGAGKSTVFAGVCFALYGDPPDRKPPTLRSHHADRDVLTQVTLEATIGGRRVRIVRIPQQMRPKRNGKGETEQKPETFLSYWAPGPGAEGKWEPVSKSHKEASDEIEALVGMNRPQFCQVVLLPQNRFTAFLRAEPVERRELLGELFHTDRFAAIEQWLTGHASGLDKECQAARGDVLRLAERIQQAAGPDLEPHQGAPVPQDPRTIGTAMAWAQRLLEAAAVAGEEHAAAAADAKAALDQARAALDKARELAQQQTAHLDAGTALELLAEQTDHIDTLRARREAARRAQHLVPLLHAVDTATTAHARAQDTETARRAALPADHADLTTADLKAAEQQTRAEHAVLEQLLPEEATVADLTTELKRIDEERRQYEQDLADARSWLQSAPADRAALDKRLTDAQAAQAQSEQHAAALDLLERRCQAAERRDTHLAAVTTAETRLVTAQAATAKALQHYITVRQQRTDGMAAELAGTLQDGQPCPVCGSSTHPQPAAPHPGQPTRDDELAAETNHQTADHAERAATRTLQDARELAAAATGEAGDTPLAELRSQHKTLAEEHAQALSNAADAGPATEELATLQIRQADMTQQEAHATAGLAARDSSYDLYHRRKTELEDKLTAARGTASSIQARIDDLLKQADRLNTAADASRATHEAATLLAEHTATAEQAAPTHGFDTPQEAAQALLTDPELTAIDDDITQWQRDRAAHETTRNDPALAAAAAQPPADTDSAEAAVTRAETAHTNASAQAHAAATRQTDLAVLTDDLTAHVTRLQPLERDHALADHLATLAAGTSPSNTVRMQLESYVLAARLEEVVDAANTRLHLMSEGRFTLSHSDAKAARGARSGLGLRITDAWTGHPRGTETLSGGESFFASLSLALGLADVVTQESGGNPLDTLFIDEGFGTLDEDTLHKVLDVLDSLRAGDRTVGVISHVTELRRRIPHRLHVRKHTGGSTLTLLTENTE